MDVSSGSRSARLRTLLGGLRHAVRLGWQAGPGLVVGVALCTVAAAVMPVAAAWLTKLSLELITHPGGDPRRLLTVGAGLVAVGLATALLPLAARYLRGQFTREVGALAQDGLFGAAERFTGLSRFEDPVFLDRLRLAQYSGCHAPGNLLGGVLTVAAGALTLAGFLGSLFALNAGMAVLVAMSAVPALAGQLRVSRRRAATTWEVGPYERREHFYQEVLTSVQAAKELRLFAAGGYLRNLMNDNRRRANAHYLRTDRRELRTQISLAMLSAVIAAAGLGWALHAAWQGRISVGDVSLFVAATAGVQSTLTSLITEIANGHQQLTLFEHYRTVVDSPADLPVASPAAPVGPLRGGIEFRDVWFRYAPDQPWVLRGLNLTIRPGRSTALVGVNGAGKSTIAKLLCRFYDPQRGSITWDGADLRELDPAALRERIGAVFQDFMHYDLSAAENIGLGSLDALTDRERLEHAARLAGVHETLRDLPDGYDTLLSRVFFQGDAVNARLGVSLSGGQWQRVALARALVRGERDLLLLDEPSSGLDPRAEYEIHKALLRHRSDRTSVLISHRLGAVRDADVLVVLDDGQVAEQGTHVDLMALDGRYARLFRMQAEGYQGDPLNVVTTGKG
ncbi:ABC transporter ATP-binding protein [Actinoplanes teichomyceticus]|uniref:ATP-binding cassette subfamily B protein n=1 Tax=Actinoplanes teichomyceticus TaxID=1867 RepID=A0A561VGZ4_ACTTI|nr:ABC transporter ATP-binding protein [Actinoplanes teichomyceticus]TWG10879.1 ATP-binding cassette subfamily B protein [Actinoplanes teichomyceticus]GIF12500.1 multidrug ABC transporter permease [Actinoplanes teichomyceticus]